MESKDEYKQTINMTEIWKDIKDCGGIFQISNAGRVKRLERTIFRKVHGVMTRTILKAAFKKVFIGTNGYPCVSVCIDQVRVQYVIHRLIAIAFIPNPENKREVNHKNGIKTDFSISNLEWCTQSENTKHAFAMGLMNVKGEKHMHAKLDNNAVYDIRENCNETTSMQYFAKKYNVNVNTVRDVVKGRTWTHI